MEDTQKIILDLLLDQPNDVIKEFIVYLQDTLNNRELASVPDQS